MSEVYTINHYKSIRWSKIMKKIDKEMVPKQEQETSITIDPTTNTASIYTCVPSMIRKVYTFLNNSEVKLILDNKYGVEIQVPSKWIKITKPRKVQYTEEQKEALRTRLAVARSQKGKEDGTST